MIAVLLATALTLSPDTVQKALGGREGAFVLIDCANGETFRSDAAACAEQAAPCSTFKIWNSAIGLETGVVTDPDALFWKWDGVKRTTVAEWNQDQTLRSAIAISCVPAYQALARKIGASRMQEWIDRIGYGDRDISAGIDVFWLPAPGRKTILISPDEQAALLCRLADRTLPFSARTYDVLKSIMKLRETERGTLYGKTGTGGGDFGGWFVGYVESQGRSYAFACRLKGDGVMGKDARAATEAILLSRELL